MWLHSLCACDLLLAWRLITPCCQHAVNVIESKSDDKLSMCAQLTPQSRVAQGLKSMVLKGAARLIGMSVLPAGLSALEASGSETDEDLSEEDVQQLEELADIPVPSLLLVTQNVRGQACTHSLSRSSALGQGIIV